MAWNIEYAKILEGVYSNGVVLRGFLYKWKLIYSYEAIVTDSGGESSFSVFKCCTRKVSTAFDLMKYRGENLIKSH
ncbi:MAG: hypothetical protein MJA31_19080 [Clostridia bacterium]|nr:hypothetical protein [Clostridia bacterium]